MAPRKENAASRKARAARKKKSDTLLRENKRLADTRGPQKRKGATRKK
jgi:hypothetical protein